MTITSRSQRHQSDGFPGRVRLLIEFAIAAAAALLFMEIGSPQLATALALPFLKDVLIQLGWLFVPLAALVIVGAGNAVNLTDGLDGLAIVPVIIAAASFGGHRLSASAMSPSPNICSSITSAARASWRASAAR